MGAVADPPNPLVLDQTEARRAEKFFFGDRLPPPLSRGLDDRPPTLISRSGSGTGVLPSLF